MKEPMIIIRVKDFIAKKDAECPDDLA